MLKCCLNLRQRFPRDTDPLEQKTCGESKAISLFCEKNNFDFETVLDEKNICGESKQIPYSVTKNCRWANPTFMKKFCLYCIWALLSNFSRLLLQQSGTLWKNFHILFHRKTSIFYLLGQFKPYFRSFLCPYWFMLNHFWCFYVFS